MERLDAVALSRITRVAMLAAIFGLSCLLPASADEEPAPVPSEVAPISEEQAPTTIDPEAAAAAAGNPNALVMPGNAWVAMGPGPNTNGQVENVGADDQVAGAVHVVAPHPTNADILYCAGTNGGIWRTDNATATSPNWVPQADGASSMSIGALEFDPLDSTNNTLLAGFGRFSSFGLTGGLLNGLLRTNNGGTTWTPIAVAPLLGESISGVAARGPILVAASNGFGGGAGRLMRSTDTGASFTTVSGSGGLPAGDIFDLVGDPAVSVRLYCSLEDNGIYRSDDTGATWTNISSSDTTLNTSITTAANNNTEMVVGPSGRLWVAVLHNGQANYIGYSDNPTAAAPTWTRMDLPLTLESNGQTEGLNPREKPGGQGAIHFSMAADPNSSNIIYIAGDRQDFPFPNAIGAVDFSGRIFRGDSTVTGIGDVAGSPQWDHMTHTQNLVFAGGGTANRSSPHADSREMRFDANGILIEGDDGGIYRRTSPTDNTGDWFSLIGNLQVTEFHNAAYDSLSDIIMGGAQDTGSSYQITTGNTTWISISTADGGDIAIDDTSTVGSSFRYSSFQFLQAFRRAEFDAGNNFLGQVFPARAGYFGAQFTTPVELNARDMTRMIIGSGSGAWESTNQGASGTFIPGIPFTNSGGHDPIAYGGRLAGVDNLDVVYVGASNGLFLRSSAPPASATLIGAFSASVRDIVLDPDDWRVVFLCGTSFVSMSPTASGPFTTITGNLTTLLPSPNIHSIEFITDTSGADAIAVGTRAGVYYALTSAPTVWAPLGTGLPNVPVYDLDFDFADDVLVAGTFGRGAWLYPMVTGADTTPPTIALTLRLGLIWPARQGLRPAGMTLTVTDDTDPNPTVDVEVWSNEPNGAAPYTPDATGTTGTNLALRAERLVPGPGRVYLVIVRATDARGNVATECRTAVVPEQPTAQSIFGVLALGTTAGMTCANTGTAPTGYTLLHSYTLP